MTPWLALSLGLWLGQTPYTGTEPVSPLPETDELDPATRELRDAREAAREEMETLETPTVTPPFLPPQTPAAPDATAAPQAPAPTDTGTTTEAATAGAAAPQTEAQGAPSTGELPPEELTTEEVAKEVRELRTQVQQLQEQLKTREEEAAQEEERTQALEEQQAEMQARAQQLEALRQERLALLASAYEWVLAADTALSVGELDVDYALAQASQALADAQGNAETAGRGETVQLMRSARSRLAYAMDQLDQRNTYYARLALQDLGWELRIARDRALARPDVSLVTPQQQGTGAPAPSP